MTWRTDHGRAAPEAQGLTWYAVAKLGGIPNSSIVRDIEAGRDAQLSDVTAVARVLGFRLELVAAECVDEASVDH